MLLLGSRRVLSPFSLRSMAFATAPAVRGLAVAPTAPGRLPEKDFAPSVVVRGSGAVKETSCLLGLTTKRLVYSSGRAISGSKAGLDSVFCAGQRSGFLSSRRRPNFATVRCEATVAEKESSTVEKYEYQAEVTRLLDLIVHSLYSNKEVFLRELVSNASDALDKLRFLSVTEPELLDANTSLEIRIQSDAEDGTVTITDTGVGMTREELVQSLGTIAESGTAKFLKALKDNKDKSTSDNNLIGQFGVGFYSAFLVADKVSVSTKSAKSDRQFVWEGEADTSVYTIREESDPDKLIPRGTAVTLYLKTDAKDEYSDPVRIQNLVKNYSQFISFPIYTYQEKTRSKEVEEEETAAEQEPSEEDSTDVAEPKKKKKVTEKYWDWELTNETKPLWMRSAKDVSKDDYNGFFKATFGDFMDPMAYAHFSTEGEIEFKSLLYVPGMAPFNTDDILTQRTKNIKLYVKRVFISDEFDGELGSGIQLWEMLTVDTSWAIRGLVASMFPRYLGFVKGVVDSNDLPLNVSREILQESRIVRIMKKRLVRKTFDMIEEIAKRENANDYKLFWTNFGKNIKLGCIEDSGNHKRLGPLLRFFSSKTAEEEFCTLDDYVGRMKEGQSAIYYLAADTVKSAKSAPFLEELSKRDLEVIFLVDPIDEVAITNLASYSDKKFVDVSKEDLDLDSADKEKDKEVEQEFRLLCDWIKGFLGEKVAKVKISNRISSSPCVLVSGKFGWSANMERIMKAQTLGDNTQLEFMRGRRVLEINPNHPIVKDLNFACKETPRSPKAKQLVELLFETAQLSSGFTPENPAEFGGRVYEMMAMALAGNRSAVTSHQGGEVAEGESGDEVEAEIVEASEVRTEGDPWKQ